MLCGARVRSATEMFQWKLIKSRLLFAIEIFRLICREYPIFLRTHRYRNTQERKAKHLNRAAHIVENELCNNNDKQKWYLAIRNDIFKSGKQ